MFGDKRSWLERGVQTAKSPEVTTRRGEEPGFFGKRQNVP
jgi:hypothetical protein